MLCVASYRRMVVRRTLSAHTVMMGKQNRIPPSGNLGRTAFAMQRTKSGNFLASLVASGLPTALTEKLQQRKARLEGVTWA